MGVYGTNHLFELAWDITGPAIRALHSTTDALYHQLYPYAIVYLRLHLDWKEQKVTSAYLASDWASLENNDYVLWGTDERELSRIRQKMLEEKTLEERGHMVQEWKRYGPTTPAEHACARPLLVLSSEDALFLDRGWRLHFEDNFILSRTLHYRTANMDKHPARFVLAVTG